VSFTLLPNEYYMIIIFNQAKKNMQINDLKQYVLHIYNNVENINP